MKDKINYKKFYDLVEKLDREKFHLGVALDENGYVKQWSVYRQDMAIDEYFSPENLPILTSQENNIIDLINFIKEQ